ncbi:Crp/Fnr family transcriptional regulator [Jiulongibacter sp. NS-SX5]|uniref:Crp/Fnr family transcriptional regulator n=1 Tax=Jiulongibacter sp. NS-SX5 TaxID=3463854 RepID=UPI00405A102F
MLDTEKLASYFRLLLEQNNGQKSELSSIFDTIQLPARSVFIEEGNKEKYIGYLKKGLIRAYTYDKKGDEKTLMLRWENQIVASHDLILLDRPSRFTYETLEPSEIIKMDYHAMDKIIKDMGLEHSRQDFLQHMLKESLEHLEAFIMLSPEERYLEFIQKQPNIFNRVPDKYIANVLGVTPVSLSRIRKRVARR